MISISDTDLGKPLSAKEITPCRRARPVREKKIKRRTIYWAIYWGWSMFSVGQMNQLSTHKFNSWV